MKKLLPTSSMRLVDGKTSAPCRRLDGYVPTSPPPQHVHVHRRPISLGSRLMRMAIARYEDHADVLAGIELPARRIEA